MTNIKQHAMPDKMKSLVISLHRVIQLLVHWLTTVSMAISALGVLIALVLISYSVVARYFLGRPSLWVNDVVTFLLVGIVMFSVSSVLRENKHLSVDLLTERLSGRPFRIAKAWAMLAVILVSAFLVVDGWETAMFSKMLGMTTFGYVQIPIYWLQLMIPLGSVMMILVASESLLRIALLGTAYVKDNPEGGQ